MAIAEGRTDAGTHVAGDERGRDIVKQTLRSVKQYSIECALCEQKLATIRDQCTGITSVLSFAGGGGGDVHRDGGLVALADQASECLGRRRLLWGEIQRVEALIDQLPDPEERLVLRLRYLDLRTWPDVMEKLKEYRVYFSDRQVFRIHGNALQSARRLWSAAQGAEKKQGVCQG